MGWQFQLRQSWTQRVDRYERIPPVHRWRAAFYRQRGRASLRGCKTLDGFVLFRSRFGFREHGTSEFKFRIETGFAFLLQSLFRRWRKRF
jgi:hypothetical protein